MGRNNADFTEGVISHEYDPEMSGPTVTAHIGDEQVGTMDLRKDGSVSYLSVKTRHQRKGIATAMWSYAKDKGLNPSHSPSSQTEAGKKWAESVGN